jgi:hypothetical protein
VWRHHGRGRPLPQAPLQIYAHEGDAWKQMHAPLIGRAIQQKGVTLPHTINKGWRGLPRGSASDRTWAEQDAFQLNEMYSSSLGYIWAQWNECELSEMWVLRDKLGTRRDVLS